MLLEKENILLGKLIGFSNGISSENDLDRFKDLIFKSLEALETKENMEKQIEELIEAKKVYLPNCLICTSPCGRTNDYYLNNLDGDKYKEKEELYKELLIKYKDTDLFMVLYYISKIGW